MTEEPQQSTILVPGEIMLGVTAQRPEVIRAFKGRAKDMSGKEVGELYELIAQLTEQLFREQQQRQRLEGTLRVMARRMEPIAESLQRSSADLLNFARGFVREAQSVDE